MLSICRRIAVAGSDIIHRVRPQAHRSVGEVFAGLGVIGWHGSQGRGPRFDHRRYVTMSLSEHISGDIRQVSPAILPPGWNILRKIQMIVRCFELKKAEQLEIWQFKGIFHAKTLF